MKNIRFLPAWWGGLGAQVLVPLGRGLADTTACRACAPSRTRLAAILLALRQKRLLQGFHLLFLGHRVDRRPGQLEVAGILRERRTQLQLVDRDIHLYS